MENSSLHKVDFQLSRNFYERTHVNFLRVNVNANANEKVYARKR